MRPSLPRKYPQLPTAYPGMEYSHYLYLRQNTGAEVYRRMEDDRGMRVTSGKVTIYKDTGNLIGISIGGGAPLCPCLYIVQIFDNTPAASDGTLEAGDEIIGVNNQNVKGKSKVEVAKMIQSTSEKVDITYNKLHAEPKQGKSLDIVLKKVKHKMVENMSSSTADALGLSRAILCNDSLVKKLDGLQKTERMYRGLIDHTRRVLKGYFELVKICKAIGDEFCKIGVREVQKSANDAFCTFGEHHRQIEKYGIRMLKQTKPILSDLGTYVSKAIPDTRLTIKKYADVKFEYLSYCLKVKEMDDEDYSYQALQEPLYRVETGNYEYRLILRCRSDARKRFAKLRTDVLEKMELLDNKHVQDIVYQLKRLMEGLTQFHVDCHKLFDGLKLFPIEVELERTAFQYNLNSYQSDEPEEDPAEEAFEANFDNDDALLEDIISLPAAASSTTEAQLGDSLALVDLSATSTQEASAETTSLYLFENLPTDLGDRGREGEEEWTGPKNTAKTDPLNLFEEATAAEAGTGVNLLGQTNGGGLLGPQGAPLQLRPGVNPFQAASGDSLLSSSPLLPPPVQEPLLSSVNLLEDKTNQSAGSNQGEADLLGLFSGPNKNPSSGPSNNSDDFLLS